MAEKDIQIVNKKAQDFLHNLQLKKDLQNLQRKIGGLNVFSILKTERTEIRHSNVLAWLIDPYGNHGLGTQFAEVFFVNISNAKNGNKNFISKLILNGLDDLTVYREKDNIDILIVSNTTKQIVAIENKTGSGIHDNQLNRYEKIINEQYPTYDKLLLYLDSKQDFADDIGKWQYVKYSVVESSLEYFIESEPNAKLKLILSDYLTIIRRNLMNKIDNDTQKLCDGIYAKYREVFDYILENKANVRSKFIEIVKELLLTNSEQLGIVYNPNWCSGVYVRFAVKGLQITGNNEKWVKDQMILLELYCSQNGKYKILSLVTYAGDNGDNEKIKEIWSKLRTPRGKCESNWRVFGGTKIKWDGDFDNGNDKQKLLDEIKDILNSPKFQELFNKIKSVIND